MLLLMDKKINKCYTCNKGNSRNMGFFHAIYRLVLSASLQQTNSTNHIDISVVKA